MKTSGISFPVNLGTRYLRSKRNALRYVSRIAIVGLILAVAIVMMVQSIMAGFELTMRERVIAVVPHVSVVSEGTELTAHELDDVVERIPAITGWVKTAEGSVLLSRGEHVVGLRLVGMDPQAYSRVSNLARYIEGRALEKLAPGSYAILLGDQVAKQLGVSTGDALTALFPKVNVTPLGVFPRLRRLVVAGTFDTQSTLDSTYGYMHRVDASKLMQRTADTVHFHITDPLVAPNIAFEVDRLLFDGVRDVFVTDWTWWWGPFYSFIRVQKNMLFVILSLLIGVAAFNLVSSLVILVYERRADVAVLRTLGGSTFMVTGAFVVVAGLIAMLGIVLGSLAGWLLGWGLELFYPWFSRALDIELLGKFFLHSLVVDFRFDDLVKIAGMAGVLAMTGAIYPAWRAASLNPAELLAHE